MNETTQNVMHAAALDKFGGIETIKFRELPLPEVGPDEVLIRIESAGVGVWDSFEREGGFAETMQSKPKFPYVLGWEGAGTIEAVGPGVSSFKVGDRVYAGGIPNPKGGFYAEYAVINQDFVSPIPGKLTTEQASVILVDGTTALRGLEDTLGLKPGETLIIFGASGGIGHIAVQLAKRMGARVFAVASGKDGVTLAKRLGADVAVDGHNDDVIAAARKFAPAGIDAALVTSGGEAADEALKSLRDGGRVAYPTGVEPEPQVPTGISVHRFDGNTDREVIGRLNRLIDSGPFEVLIARSFPLKQAAEAHRALKTHFLGKLALTPTLRVQ